jgi:hypothetical protein
VVKATFRPLYPLERYPVPIVQEAGLGLRDGTEGRGKSRPLPGFDPRTVQPVASRCTDYAVPTCVGTCINTVCVRACLSLYTHNSEPDSFRHNVILSSVVAQEYSNAEQTCKARDRIGFRQCYLYIDLIVSFL